MPSTDWNIRLVNARQAQRMLPRKPDTDDEIDWRGVEIALVDTGYTTHPAFGPWDAGSSPVLQVGRGKNFVESDPPNNRPRDPLNYSGQPGHGTRVGSVMCGNLPGLMVGIAPGVPTIPYRVTNTTVLASTATRERVAAAIRDAVDRNGCEVISISMGFPLLDLFGQRELRKAVDHAYDNGVIVVGAGGQVIDKVVYPGKFFRSIGVGGVTPDWKVWFEYDRAELDFIDVWAPGGDVYRANSILVDGQVTYRDPLPGDGTSYAAVHVSAAAAMWTAVHRDALAATYPEPWQKIEAFREVLMQSHITVHGSYAPAAGTGILDILALLRADLPDPASLNKGAEAEGQVF